MEKELAYVVMRGWEEEVLPSAATDADLDRRASSRAVRRDMGGGAAL